MPTKTPQELHSLVTNILLAVGATEANASRVAEALVSSHLAGVDPHGVWHLAGIRARHPGWLPGADCRAGNC